MDSTNHILRHIESRVKTALADTRVVAIVGPRQSGKTTLIQKLASADGRTYLTLDNTEHLQFAKDDPDGFLRDHESVAIDEVQHAPEILLTIKRMVDENPSPGRFLITGSVDLFHNTISPDSLAGRIEVIELLPFSQAEICKFETPQILNRLFTGDFPVHETVGRTEVLVTRVLHGGYPEALERSIDHRREAWLRSYVQTVMTRDVFHIARINKPEKFIRLIDYAAVSSGQLLNFSTFGTELQVDRKSVDRWLSLLEHLYLVRRVKAWHYSERKRLVKSQKMHFLDSGLLAAIRGIDAAKIQRDRHQFGALLECFVLSELMKATALNYDWIRIYHYRDTDKVEVDFVLECSPGKIVGIEVKSRATVRPNDFKGLKRLRDLCGDKFVSGVVFHDGDTIQQMYPKMFAMPVKMLWEA